MSANDGRGAILIAIAREGIADEHGFAPRTPREEPWLAEAAATFVTLRLDGELRGCIGSLEALRPLGEDVYANARGAAYRDTRFAPVTAQERDRLDVEVSLLSTPQPIAVACEAEALAQLRPGVDGVIVQYEDFRATFLPQVWEQLPQPHAFLRALKRKAGLAETFWSDGVRVCRYTVEKFVEEPM